jgi:hypothetical protein
MTKAILILTSFVALVFGIVALAVLLNGWILTILWGWFVAPLFGLPALTLKSACGLSLIVGYLTGGLKHDNKEEEEKGKEYLKYVKILNPFFVLLMGWIIYSC